MTTKTITIREDVYRMLLSIKGTEESSKYLRVQGGRVLYQFTVRVKLLKEASGGGMGFDD